MNVAAQNSLRQSREVLTLAMIAGIGALGLAPSVSADTAKPGTPLTPIAHESSSHVPSCPRMRGHYRCFWFVNRVQNIPGLAYGKKEPCVGFEKSSSWTSATCSVGYSRAAEITATVGGSAPVGDFTLSETVSYSVTDTETVTGAYTASIPPHHYGYI